jgi:hypothetical protein
VVTKVGKSRIVWVVLPLLLMPLLAGCGHKLIAHSGDTTISVYGNKEQFDKVQAMKSQGGPAGLFGGIGESMLAKKVDNETPVKVISSDEEGAQIEVLDGRDKGLQGYVAKDNLD